jgi:hypothetical protein
MIMTRFRPLHYLAICLLLSNTSYSQTLLGLAKNNSAIVEDLCSGKKRRLLENDRFALDSMIRKKSTNNNTQLSVILKKDLDTLYVKVYLFDNRKLFIKYGGMALFVDDRFLWKQGHLNCILNAYDYSFQENQKVDFIPLFSSDLKSLIYRDDSGPMFVNRSAILELNLSTGEIRVVKRMCKNPTYSPDGKFILLEDSKHDETYYVYNRVTKKIIRKFRGLKAMYWIK